MLRPKNLLILIAVGALVFLNGCATGKKQSVSEKIQTTLLDMESYECTAALKRISNKGEDTYETKQYYKTSGEYKLLLTAPEKVAGNYTVYDGEKIYQYNPRLSDRIIVDVPDSPHRNELFLGQFIKNYMNSEEVSIETARLDSGKCTVLEAVIPGNNKYLSTEKLWVDNETLLPVQFVIYDKNGDERYIVTYEEFEYNVKLDDSIFTAKEE